MSVMWTSVDTLIVRPYRQSMTASSPLLVWRLHVDFGRVFSASVGAPDPAPGFLSGDARSAPAYSSASVAMT